MKQQFLFLTLFAAIALLCGCLQQPEEQPRDFDQNFVQEPPLVEGRAENLVLDLNDFNAESFKMSQFEGAYSKDTASLQQFKTFFKPTGFPIVSLDENTFVLTQTLTIINSPTAREEIESLYESELNSEREKHSITIIETNFVGEKSTMIKSTLEGNDLYKAFIAYSGTLTELSLITKGMPAATAKEKLKHYSILALSRLE